MTKVVSKVCVLGHNIICGFISLKNVKANKITQYIALFSDKVEKNTGNHQKITKKMVITTMTQYCITGVLHNLNCICKRFISPGTSIDGVIDFIWPGEDFCATLWQSLTYWNCAPHPANPANQAASTTEKTDILFKSTWYFNPIENGGRILDAPG